MWDQYSKRARAVIAQAQMEAGELDQAAITPEPLLLGLMHDRGNIACLLMSRLGVDPNAIHNAVREQDRPAQTDPARDIHFTRESKHVFKVIYDEAALLNNNYIGTEHLLLALAGDAGLAGQVLRGHGLTPMRVREATVKFQSGPARPSGPGENMGEHRRRY